MNDNNLNLLADHAMNMRKLALEMAYCCGLNSHLGGGLSLVDAMAVLYGSIMNAADNTLPYEAKDKLILSKGHGVLGYYAALAEFGIIDKGALDSFLEDGSDLIAHPVMNTEMGIEASTGSLGQGISIGVGLALAAKKKGCDYKTYVICGNGECNEGSVWEACMAAVNFGLNGFVLYIDNNHMQSDGFSDGIMNVSHRYTDILRSMGFQTTEIDGNDIKQLYDAFSAENETGKPRAIVGNTIKGKGVSFMENNPEWHHNRLTQTQYELAIKELQG